MLNILKWIWYAILSCVGVGLAIGIGAVLTALGAILSTIVVGGSAMLVIILMVKELLED